MDADAPRPEPAHVPGYWRRRMQAAARWLHIYVSMVSFAILAFFAVTGLTLNHADAFTSRKQRTTQTKGSLPVDWVKTGDDKAVARLEIVERLRSAHGVRGAVADFRIEENQCAVSFRGPGYTADAFIDRANGSYDLAETRLGLVAVINDLHKGRDTGVAWSWIIDASAILMTIVSISGLALILFLKRRRVPGLVVGLLGTAACWLVFQVWVP